MVLLIDCVSASPRPQENRGFTDRCIAKAQKMSILDGSKIHAIHDYLLQKERISYDTERDIFWVIPTSGPPEIAVWMMPLVMGELK